MRARRSGPASGAGDDTPEAHDWLQALFDESPVAIGFSRDGVMLDANPTYLRLFGYDSAADLRGRSLLEQIAPSHRQQVLEMVTQRARGDRLLPDRYQTLGLRKDGTEFPFEVTTTRVVVADGPLNIAFISDVSDRENAIGALTASEERFRTLSAAAVEGVFLHADGRILLANEAGARMYGFDAAASMVGASLLELTHPESHAVLADHVRRGSTEPYEGTARRRDGTTFIAEVHGTTLSHQGKPTRVTVIRDVTDRRRIEAEQRVLAERVRQAQKRESLGLLAGGVSHDFNNILTVITNGVALAKREAGLGAASVAHLDGIALAAERAADLCRQMLAYAGEARLEREAVELSALVGEMSSMLEASICKKAKLVRELAPELPNVFGDATQIRQLVMNLVLNASEAIVDRGTVRVSTGTGKYDATELERFAARGEPNPGAYVWLEVEDDGVGMDPSTLAQMFDPFFTTKFVGRGLGMAAVLGIVRGHQGAIDVESSPGQGTRVRVLFPVCTTKAVGPASKPAQELRGHGVVLLVDDEKNVRRSTELLLRGFGFDVLVACDGAEAIEVFKTASERIDAVLLDLTMPRLDGTGTLKELRRLAPEVPVILTSGYGSARLDGEPDRSGGPDAVLAKPYTSERLLATLQRVMRRQ